MRYAADLNSRTIIFQGIFQPLLNGPNIALFLHINEVNHDKTGKVDWEWEPNQMHAFFSRFQGAVQKLPNDNYLITSSNTGHVFEITGGRRPKVVWEFINPVVKGKPQCMLTRAVR